MSDYKVKFVNYPAQYKAHKKELDATWHKVMEGGDFILREDVENFEKNLAEYVGAKYAVGVNSGTDALQLTLRALGVGYNSEVITSSHTFWATIEAIENCGARAVLVDSENGLMDVKEVHDAISQFTRAIIPVHIAGDTCDMEHLKYMAESRNIPLVEDACQALGASKPYFAQCYSFYPAKILGGVGDGGAVVTDSSELYEAIKLHRNHGGKPKPRLVGMNSRLDNLQAALLNVRLKYLPEVLLRRKTIANRYNKGLKGLPLQLPKERLVYQDYIIRVSDRDQLKNFLEQKGIETLINEYPFPQFYEKSPKTVLYESQTLRLPCNETLEDNEIDYVIEKISEFYSGTRLIDENFNYWRGWVNRAGTFAAACPQ